MLYLIIFGFIAISFLVSRRLKSKFKKYSQTPLSSGFSGKEIAERMLNKKGIHDVQVTCVQGQLTDHYNPTNKTVNLSQAVYHGRNIAAAAIAAHECGHAVQHQQAYKWLTLRSAMVPITSASSKLMNVIFFIAIFGGMSMDFGWEIIMTLVISAQAILTAFSLITLPVEFDASNRALAWLQNDHIASPVEMNQAEDALKWAARTYLVAALASVTTLLYYVLSMAGDE